MDNSNSTRTGTEVSRAAPRRATTCVAISELPPSAKKLVVQADRLDAEDVREDVRHDLLDGVRGIRNDFASNTGTGSARRSILPDVVRGRASIGRNIVGTMYDGRRNERCSRRFAGSNGQRSRWMRRRTRRADQRHAGRGAAPPRPGTPIRARGQPSPLRRARYAVRANFTWKSLSHVLQFARAIGIDDPPHEVTGAVHPLARRHGSADEPLRRQVGAARYPRASCARRRTVPRPHRRAPGSSGSRGTRTWLFHTGHRSARPRTRSRRRYDG